ncbi:MAG: sulfite dehydrogenase [Bryobacterales bacterium]|nr:sulfite dehydrogenase [Bryobacterales bacterium]MDE0626391.1 sulfite dehydrogenase [Bryobacterales bacterium]
MDAKQSSRRAFLGAGAFAGAALTACSAPDATPPEAATAPSLLGAPVRRYGERSPHETVARGVRDSQTPEAASSRTPLDETYGIITPSALHFERHHAGVPDIDPTAHKLLIHGLVERPMMFTLSDLKRMPSVSRVHFVECSGNSGGEWSAKGAPTVRLSHGLASCSEWTGVPLRVLLDEVGVKPEAKWLLAEGDDACRMQRSVMIEKALDDAIVAYGQNGEALRPEQGYPVRLVLPGWEGNTNVKWLRRIKLTEGPQFTKDETSKYTELMEDGEAWIFTFEMDAKSVITAPSGGHAIGGPGYHEVTGLAWSGRGKITSVEVSTDGGANWSEASLQQPVYSRAFTRFRLPWNWDGSECVLLSRCRDDTGYVQPTRQELIAQRGRYSAYHCNRIKGWRIAADGSVSNAEA